MEPKEIRKKLKLTAWVLERMIKQYKIKGVPVKKKGTYCMSYNINDIKNIIDFESKIGKIPEGMTLLTTIRNKYSLNSIDWPSIYSLPDAPQPKGKAYDSAKNIRQYYSIEEWHNYFIRLKSEGHPLLCGKTKIPGESKQIQMKRELKELQIEQEEEIEFQQMKYVHPERQKAYEQAARTKLLNKAFMVMQ